MRHSHQDFRVLDLQSIRANFPTAGEGLQVKAVTDKELEEDLELLVSS